MKEKKGKKHYLKPGLWKPRQWKPRNVEASCTIFGSGCRVILKLQFVTTSICSSKANFPRKNALVKTTLVEPA